MKRIATTILTLALFIVLVGPGIARATEGGVGHYAPGGMASFIDAAPPGFGVQNIFMYYSGSAGASRQLPFGGILASNIDVTSYAEMITIFYTAPFTVLDAKFSFAALIPYVWVDVKGDVSLDPRLLPRLSRSVTVNDSASGIGDIALIPFWLGWTKGDFKWDVKLGIYAPTGDYEEGQLANVGLNYWTFEPVASISYISKEIGLEVSAFAGFDFNTKNNATDYQSGDIFHFDLTIAEHLPLFGYGTIGIGANYFYWKQFTEDSGSGALLGSFEGLTTGIGPVVSYVSPPIGGHTIVAEVKWLPELNVNSRTSGDYVWFKAAFLF